MELSQEHKDAWAAQHQHELTRPKRVQVQHLMRGDVLRPTGATVVWPPVVRTATPPGKRELRIRRRSGQAATVVWDARTQVNIEPRLT